MLIGITGGIGSGKSLALELLKEKGYVVISCDAISREVVERGTEGLAEVVAEFGPAYLKADGSLNRAKLGEKVFSDEESRRKLNAVTHPRILARVEELAKRYPQEQRVFVEVPLLFESGAAGRFDRVWLIVSDRKTRLDRIVMRDKIGYDEAERRMDSQLSDEEKAKFADTILYNNGNIGDFQRELERTLSEL